MFRRLRQAWQVLTGDPRANGYGGPVDYAHSLYPAGTALKTITGIVIPKDEHGIYLEGPPIGHWNITFTGLSTDAMPKIIEHIQQSHNDFVEMLRKDNCQPW